MKRKVFISHSSKDKPFARQLNQDLQSNNIETFFDEKDILLGDNLEQIISYSIKQDCSHLIWILSKNSIKSDWVKKEVEIAKEKMQNEMLSKIILIKIDDCHIPEEFNKYLYENISDIFGFTALNKYSFPEEKDESTYRKLIGKLLKAISNDRYLLHNDYLEKLKHGIDDSYEFNNTFTTYINYFEKRSYFEILADKIKVVQPNITEQINPIRLSSLFYKYMNNLKIGDEIKIEFNENKSTCHFAGFDKSIDGMTVRGKIRRDLGLEADWENEPKRVYNVLIKADFDKSVFKIKALNHTCEI